MKDFESKLNNLLLELFQKHGVNGSFIEDENIIFLDQCIKAHCHLYDKTATQTTVVQLDIIIEIGLDKVICESCAGLGINMEEAVSDSFNSFVRNSFHTILAAFFSSEYDDQVVRNERTIGSIPYDVVSSQIGIRGKQPDKLSTKWIKQFENEIKKQELDNGINWIRIFYAISGNQITTSEVLINNNTDTSLQDIARTFDLTLTEDFYTLRLFYILQSKWDFGRLSAIILWASQYCGEKDFEVIEDVFSGLGMSALDIGKAYAMIPLAISYAFIEKIAPNALTTKAQIMNKEKQTFDIDLNDEFFFSESYKWAKNSINNNLINRDSLIGVLQMSSLFNALNNALNNGSNPEDLKFSETILILDDYTANEQKK
ncbi:MAG: DUF6348 family protein [Dysgonomonas sp.]|nr:DUF6348 family protein [Dysgonomonas sp.]